MAEVANMFDIAIFLLLHNCRLQQTKLSIILVARQPSCQPLPQLNRSLLGLIAARRAAGNCMKIETISAREWINAEITDEAECAEETSHTRRFGQMFAHERRLNVSDFQSIARSSF